MSQGEKGSQGDGLVLTVQQAYQFLKELWADRQAREETVRQAQRLLAAPSDPLEQDRQKLAEDYGKLRARASAEAQFLSDLNVMEASYAETYGKSKAASLMREVRSRLGLDPQDSVDESFWKEGDEEESDGPR